MARKKKRHGAGKKKKVETTTETTTDAGDTKSAPPAPSTGETKTTDISSGKNPFLFLLLKMVRYTCI